MGWVALDLAVPLSALVVLIICWWNGDVRVHTKVILTTFYLASWGLLLFLLLFEKEWAQLFIIVQLVLLMVTGVITFGWDFLKGRG